MAAGIANIDEKELQRAVHTLLSDPSRVYTLVDGKSLQVLSIGRLNVHEGPDFLDAVILLDGLIEIGTAEFHRNAADWNAHGHSNNREFDSCILHIVTNVNADLPLNTLYVTEQEILDVLNRATKAQSSDSTDLLEVQQYALLRLLRQANEFAPLKKRKTSREVFEQAVMMYLEKFFLKRRRPTYTKEKLQDIAEHVGTSPHSRFVESIANSFELSGIEKSLQKLLAEPIAGEGDHLRREIVVNALFPVSVQLASRQTRIQLFNWFWSVEALFEYGILKREFPHLPQMYLWQQQGMLELLRTKKAPNNTIQESIQSYGLIRVIAILKDSLESPDIEDELR